MSPGGPGTRRGLGALLVLAGVVMIVLAVGSAVGGLVLRGGDTTVTPVVPGEPVAVDAVSGLPRPLVVYGDPAAVAATGSRLADDLGCVVTDATDPGDTEPVVHLPLRLPDSTLDGRTLAPAVQTGEARRGGTLVCDGPAAQALAPLAVGRAGPPAVATGLTVVLAVAALLLSVVLLVVGTRLLRAR